MWHCVLRLWNYSTCNFHIYLLKLSICAYLFSNKPCIYRNLYVLLDGTSNCYIPYWTQDLARCASSAAYGVRLILTETVYAFVVFRSYELLVLTAVINAWQEESSPIYTILYTKKILFITGKLSAGINKRRLSHHIFCNFCPAFK